MLRPHHQQQSETPTAPAKLSPWADPHEGDGGTGEENGQEEEGLPAPDIRQSTDQRSREKRQEALKEQRASESDHRPDPFRTTRLQSLN